MRYCNHCHKLYDERKGKCPCRKTEKRVYKTDSFYTGKAWRALSNYIRMRDYNMDRLALYLFRSGTPADGLSVYKLLYDYLIDVTGNIRTLGGSLVVHHIVPRNENYTLQYDVDNLITLNSHAHEFIHQLYSTGKQEEVMAILREAVKFKM